MHACMQVEQHREHLIHYMIFLRVTPLVPNWFINITAPGMLWSVVAFPM